MRTYERLGGAGNVRSVPARRTVNCPACGAGKSTAANRGVRLVCVECGEAFRCPAPDAGPAGAPPAAPETPGGIKIVRGVQPVVKQTARPRERGTAPPPAVPPAPPAPAPAPAPVTNPTGKTGDHQRLVEAGRRGGLADYAARRRGRTPR